MKSEWSVVYVGPHTNVMIKKLQRVLGVKALKPETIRYEWQGHKLEATAFEVEHDVSDWDGLIASMMKLAGLLNSSWRIDVSSSDEMYGELSAEADQDTYEFAANLPSGFRSVKWRIRADQSYSGGLNKGWPDNGWQ